jgi:hypothetical protein
MPELASRHRLTALGKEDTQVPNTRVTSLEAFSKSLWVGFEILTTIRLPP